MKDVPFHTKIVAKASLIPTSEIAAKKLAQAKAAYLEERGKFPDSVVTQPDILALQAVILTTGRPGNLNDDVILNEEILPVLWTAALKPFNIEHSKKMIGCMFDAFAVNKDTGEVVAGMETYEADEDESAKEKEQLMNQIAGMPENLDIITNQVLWSAHFPEECAAIKQKAIAGDIFVSMEVWFTAYDYLIGNRIVKRTPELAPLLDPKLRIKGGNGYLGVDRIKRVPRNLTFAGNAAVQTPANPDSIIIDVMDRGDMTDKKEMEVEDEVGANAKLDKKLLALVEANTLVILESLSDESEVSDTKEVVLEAGCSGDQMGNEVSEVALAEAKVDEVVTSEENKEMANETELKVVELLEANAVLKSKHVDLEAALAAANKEKEELRTKQADLETKLNETLALVKEREEALSAKAEAFEQLKAEKTVVDTKLAEISAKLADIEEKRKLDTRKATLASIGLTEDRIVKILAKTNTLADEAFALEVEDLKALMAELAPKAPSVLPEAAPAAETPAVETAVEETVEASAETEEAATEEELAEVLEETEEEPVPAAAAVGAVRTDISEAAEYLRSAMAKVIGS